MRVSHSRHSISLTFPKSSFSAESSKTEFRFLLQSYKGMKTKKKMEILKNFNSQAPVGNSTLIFFQNNKTLLFAVTKFCAIFELEAGSSGLTFIFGQIFRSINCTFFHKLKLHNSIKQPIRNKFLGTVIFCSRR